MTKDSNSTQAEIEKLNKRIQELEAILLEQTLPFSAQGQNSSNNDTSDNAQQSRFQTWILGEVSDAVIALDENRLINYWNQAAARMYNLSREEVIGYPLSRVYTYQWLHPEDAQISEQAIARDSWWKGETVQALHNGKKIHVELSVTALRDKNNKINGHLAVIRDITERAMAYQMLEKRVEERTKELSSLLEISRSMASTLAVKPLAGLILDQLKTVLDYNAAVIFSLEGTELKLLEKRSTISRVPPPELTRLMNRLFTLHKFLENPNPVLVDDLQGSHALAISTRNLIGAASLAYFIQDRSFLLIPLIVKERVVGLLSVVHTIPGFYSNKDLNLAFTIAHQAAVALENARLYEQAQVLATLEERQRLARDLHDSTSQVLYSISLGIKTIKTLLDRGEYSQLPQPVEYISSLAQAGLDEMRTLIFELRPDSLAVEGLLAALNRQATSLRSRFKLEVTLTLPDNEPDIPLNLKDALYRIAREALYNVVKHARASNVTICLNQTTEPDARLVMEIIDNGIGFITSTNYPGHIGLHSMRERAEQLDGLFEIESEPGKGTSIFVSVPLRLNDA